MPGASVQKQDTASFMSWSTGAEDGSYCLMNGVQNGWISRCFILIMLKTRLLLFHFFSSSFFTKFYLISLFPQLHKLGNAKEVEKEKVAICFLYRKPTTLIDSDGEADLQGLVSNILDEAVSQNGCNRRYGINVCRWRGGGVVQMTSSKFRH